MKRIVGSMKKLTPERQAWLRHHAERSLRRRLVGRGRDAARSDSPDRSDREVGVRFVTGYSRGETRQILLAKDPKPIPSVLCFDRNYEATVGFLSELAEWLCDRALKTRRGYRFPPSQREWHDFKDIEYVSPSVALVLAAEYDRSRIISRVRRLFTINMDSWKPEVRSTLTDLGFLDLLDIDYTPPPSNIKRTVVRFRSDTKRNVDMRLASETLQEVIRLAANAAVVMIKDDVLANFRTVLQAIGEALINTSEHAYPAGHRTELPSVDRWWITGAVDPDARRLTFTVYDQGVTIPRAIPHGPRFEKVQRFFRRIARRDLDADDVALDGQSIASAVRVGASGTKLEHRGKGLGLMRNCILRERTGRLRIISRNGDYMACSGSKDRQEARSSALRGTLIEWTVDL